MSRMTKRRLGELLQSEGLLSDEQLRNGIEEQKKRNCLLGQALVNLEIVTEDQIAQALVSQFGAPFLSANQCFIGSDLLELFSEKMLRDYQFMPVDRIGNILTIVCAGMLNQDVLDEMERLSGFRIQMFVGTQSDVKAAIDKHFDKESKKEEGAQLSELGSLLLETEKDAKATTGIAEPPKAAPAELAEPAVAAEEAAPEEPQVPAVAARIQPARVETPKSATAKPAETMPKSPAPHSTPQGSGGTAGSAVKASRTPSASGSGILRPRQPAAAPGSKLLSSLLGRGGAGGLKGGLGKKPEGTK